MKLNSILLSSGAAIFLFLPAIAKGQAASLPDAPSQAQQVSKPIMIPRHVFALQAPSQQIDFKTTFKWTRPNSFHFDPGQLTFGNFVVSKSFKTSPSQSRGVAVGLRF